jgi:glutathione synthase/RimK-type ligase-like ATP-grasp enzyme
VILVVSYEGEEHTDAVVRRLEAMQREVVRIDLADFPSRAALVGQWHDGHAPSYRIDTPKGTFDLAQARVVWWRRVRPFAVDHAIAQPERRQFAASETSQAVMGVLDALRCPWINPRLADDAAHHKPYQWTVAQKVGLRVPRTLVTTQAEAARAFIEDVGLGRVVFKAFLASIEEWRETRLVNQEDLSRLDLLRYAPVIFQEYIAGVDLRVTLIGDKVFAAEIDARQSSYPVDMRMVIGEGTVRAVELPEALVAKLLELQRRLGLVYGAVDLRQTDAGEYHFLEVNPAGQWMFCEERAGLPITQAHAELLAHLADGHSIAGSKRA